MGPSAGFVSDFGAGTVATTFKRAAAYVFENHAVLRQAIDMALGLNRALFAVRILPALYGTREGR
jgi:ATP/maltotriose-dependent transcriptional regulator MalT